MKFSIWHAKYPTFLTSKHPEFNKTNFTKVAEVEAQNVGDTFRITNHIDQDWTTNSEVTWKRSDGCSTRSTSVGDVVIDEAGQKFRCEMAGWSIF